MCWGVWCLVVGGCCWFGWVCLRVVCGGCLCCGFCCLWLVWGFCCWF
ncbi:hypothetical protein [Pseudomonas syringae group genomosp. 7]